tara:strand:- start:41 stop:1126 length:1086 start_codon:yes stop_codon:yes gene_type:complete
MITTLTVEDNNFLTFTPEILEATGWKEGDVLEWIDNNDGSFTLVNKKMRDEFLWVEKYRPKTIEECILPKETKKTFKSFLDKGEIPNMLLAGPAGCGKTTVAKALCNELGVDYYVINGSDEGRFLDTVRNTAKNFASTVSLSSTARHKVIIIDEADNTTNDVQLLLRAFIEEFHGNCRFIFTCNFKNKILEPLHSRTTVVEFGIGGKQKPAIAAAFFKRIQEILDTESIEYDNKVLVELINKHFPDWRRVLNECQRYAASGNIDSGILATFSDVKVNDLVKKLKEKDYPEVRKWVVNNLDNDTSVLLRRIYDACYDSMVPSSIPSAVLCLAKYQYQMAFVADQEINMLACLTEIMVECEFK